MASASTLPGTSGENAAARQENDDDSSVDSDVDRSDTSEEYKSEPEETFDDATHDHIDPASLESPTFEKDNKTDSLDVVPVWKDLGSGKYMGEIQEQNYLKTAVSDPDPPDKESVPRGIQSLFESSLTDCTLYVMFAVSNTFDYIFKTKQANYKDPVSVMRVLKDYIVTPLRKVGFVGAKRALALKLVMQRQGNLKRETVIEKLSCDEFIGNLLKSISLEPLSYRFKMDQRNNVSKEPLYALGVKLADMKLDATSDTTSEFSLKTVTSQQLVEFYSLSKNEKITPPRNLVIEIDRTSKTANDETGKSNMHEYPVLVQALPKIYLADIIIGCPRHCLACKDANVPATLECIDCFMLDETYMQLNKCFYCDECYRKAHLGMTHRSNRLYPADTEELQKYTNLKWSLYGEKQLAEKDPVNAADGPEQVIRGNYDSNTDDNSVEADLITYPYELYAIVCQSKSHVAYVRTDVKLSDDTILKYSDYQHKINFENSDKELKLDATAKPKTAAAAAAASAAKDNASDTNQSADLDTASSARGSTVGGDETTKPKNPADASAQASTSAAAKAGGGEQGQGGAAGSSKSEAWLIFDPQEQPNTDIRGFYYLPQVHTVQNFDDLIKVKMPEERFGQTSGAEGSDKDNVVKGDLLEEEHRHRLTCDSVALFYRPMMEVKQEIGKDAKLKSLETTAASK